MRLLRNILRRFGRDESGAVMVEALIVLPIMLWGYLALFVYWDAYRSINTAQKAAYTISDMISRELRTLPPNYITGARDIMRYMIDKDQTVAIRVTSVRWSATNARYEVHWSRSPNNAKPQLTTATLQNYVANIPKMSDGTYVTIVETWVSYHSAFDVGLSDGDQQQFIVTRPRFYNCINLTGATLCADL